MFDPFCVGHGFRGEELVLWFHALGFSFAGIRIHAMYSLIVSSGLRAFCWIVLLGGFLFV